jgi:Cdc6-like AAA superfamily ATPase
MIASFKLIIDELDNLFIEKLKQMFNHNKIIEIHISEEMDETDYLLSSLANRESLESMRKRL